MTVFGTRPEAIKLASVIKELESKKEFFHSIVVVTAQHREMLDQILDLFQITPDYDLNIMQPNQSLFDVTNRILVGLEAILKKEKPDILLVQGDTTTTFVAALSAFYLKIPVGHIEAGLRTFDKFHPFPEEMNRRITSSLADLNFVPTKITKGNLLKEGFNEENIFITGNTVIDALLATTEKDYSFIHPILRHIDFENHRIVLVTAHRRESWGDPLRNICQAIQAIVAKHQEVEIVFSVHLNPRVREIVHSILGGDNRIHLINPLDYQPFVHLMKKSYLILTDSGGIQEEAPSLGKPVLVLRETTERPEAIEAGTAKLVGRDADKIYRTTQLLLTDESTYNQMARVHNPYGDGKASQRIINIIKERISVPFSVFAPKIL